MFHQTPIDEEEKKDINRAYYRWGWTLNKIRKKFKRDYYTIKFILGLFPDSQNESDDQIAKIA